MTKLFFITAFVIFIVFDILIIICSLILSGRSKEFKDISATENLLCPKCRIGKDSYSLDKHSEVCPYISCYKNGKCSAFAPIETDNYAKQS